MDRKLQKFGMFHVVELRHYVEKAELREQFLLLILGLCLKMQKNPRIREESVKWDKINSKMIKAIKMAILELIGGKY